MIGPPPSRAAPRRWRRRRSPRSEISNRSRSCDAGRQPARALLPNRLEQQVAASAIAAAEHDDFRIDERRPVFATAMPMYFAVSRTTEIATPSPRAGAVEHVRSRDRVERPPARSSTVDSSPAWTRHASRRAMPSPLTSAARLPNLR